ncbi:AsmA-like C-terminal region [Flavobacteriaceae bacterium MAR_2010_188]|nr:AsmA-like C-terminal region [Flavobacteriaceae bacterium MAR_2010_188]
MKKALKIIGIILVIIVLALFIIPFAFQSQIQDAVKRYMNQNLNAKVEFSDVNLSFFRSFPQAQVDVYDLEITNLKPFEDETLATAKNVSFSMSVKELFKGADEAIIINKVNVDEALLTLKVDSYGNENFNILKETDPNAEATTFTYDIEDYKISKSALTYTDETSDFTMNISELEHSGHARFTDQISELDTESEANVSLSIDSTNYLDNNHVRLSALIDMDINNQKYTFKENTGYINQLPLEFEGYVQQIENGQDIDISFKNPESSFKSFLAIVPEAYSKNFDDVQTTGDFIMNGHIKGINSEERIPNIDIKIASDNASFKYPDLPKSVSDITIKMNVLNTTGNIDDTYVNIETFNFRIDQDNFKSSAVLRELNKNMKVSADIDGTINLANLTKAYPIELEQQLTGILKAKINTNFDMEAVEKNAYERINNSGTINISNMVFSTEALAKPIHIANADMTLGNGNVTVTNFKATTGSSDISATGNLNNLVGFVLSDKGLQGNFNVTSNSLVVSDFMTETIPATTETSQGEVNTTTTKDAVKIPDFLNCTINVNANSVLYDDLLLKDVKGALVIKDQQASIQNLTSSIFDGILAVQGNVSTKTDVPIFDISLAADGFSIAKSFSDLNLLQQLAPIAKALNGTLNTNIRLAGTLDDSMSPNLKSITGNAFAELLATAINPETSKVIQELGGALNFIDFSKLDLRDLQTNLDFSDGFVNVKPFGFKYQDIEIVVAGSHSFDNKMNYNATFNVPAKYLGSEVNRLIGKINDNDVNKITIPVAANITGTFSSPKVATDLSSAVSNLTKQLIEIEKQKLLNNGKNKILEILGGMPKAEQPKTTPADSTRKDSIPSVFKTPNIFKTDTTRTKTPVEENVKDILGGLIKNRNKEKPAPKTTTPKDTTNQGN